MFETFDLIGWDRIIGTALVTVGALIVAGVLLRNVARAARDEASHGFSFALLSIAAVLLVGSALSVRETSEAWSAIDTGGVARERGVVDECLELRTRTARLLIAGTPYRFDRHFFARLAAGETCRYIDGKTVDFAHVADPEGGRWILQMEVVERDLSPKGH